MRWNCMSKALHFLQITAKQQYCPFFTVFLTIKTSSQNISITLLQISLKLHEHRGRYWRKKLLWMILEEQFPVPRNTSVSKISNSVISLLWQLRCHCNPDHNKFSSLFNTFYVMAIFPNLCLWWRRLYSNFGGIDPEKLYRATPECYTELLKGSIFLSVSEPKLEGLTRANQVPEIKGAILLDHPDENEWSEITRITLHKISRWINSGQGLISSKHVPQSKWSRINDPDPDHPKGTHP